MVVAAQHSEKSQQEMDRAEQKLDDLRQTVKTAGRSRIRFPLLNSRSSCVCVCVHACAYTCVMRASVETRQHTRISVSCLSPGLQILIQMSTRLSAYDQICISLQSRWICMHTFNASMPLSNHAAAGSTRYVLVTCFQDTAYNSC